MSVNTKITICNKALKLIKQNTIQKLDEETKEAEIIRLNYDFVKKLVLGLYPWSASIYKENLKLEPNAESFLDYQFAYQLPIDMVKVLDSNARDYKIKGNYLYSNNSQCYINYIKNINESEMPIYLVSFFIIKLAVEISYSFLDDLAFINYLRLLVDTDFKLATRLDSNNNHDSYYALEASWLANK